MVGNTEIFSKYQLLLSFEKPSFIENGGFYTIAVFLKNKDNQRVA